MFSVFVFVISYILFFQPSIKLNGAKLRLFYGHVHNASCLGFQMSQIYSYLVSLIAIVLTCFKPGCERFYAKEGIVCL